MDGREEQRTSPWVYVAIGCAIPIVLVAVLVGGVALWGYRTARNIQKEMKDPATRAEKVKQVLGSRELPESYHPVMSLSIPFIMEMAILSDREPVFDEDKDKEKDDVFGERGFIYVKSIRGRKHKKLRDYLEGEANVRELVDTDHIALGDLEEIRRGSFDQQEMKVLYVAHRGSLTTQGKRAEGIVTMLLMECPGDGKQRLGIWFGPEPEAAPPGKPPDYAGTPADESLIRGFLAHFSLCT